MVIGLVPARRGTRRVDAGDGFSEAVIAWIAMSEKAVH